MVDIDYVERFSDVELAQIIDEGLIYMCACPAQVAEAIRKLRGLYRYQLNCLEDSENSVAVHQLIAKNTLAALAELEECMEQILALEQWDRTTLQMPEGLRRRQMIELLGE